MNHVDAVELPVEPKLFELVERYAKQIEEGRVSVKDPLRRTTPIVEFCRTFFQQFFEHELKHEITGVDQDAKLEATRLRIDREAKADEEPTRLLIGWFEELCDIWPDVLGFSYGGSATEFRRFHKTYVVRLLERIKAWAQSRHYQELVESAEKALSVYRPAVKKL